LCAEAEVLIRQFVVVQTLPPGQFATLVAGKAYLEDTAPRQLELHIQAVVLNVTSRVIPLVRSYAEAEIREQPLGTAERGNEAVRIRSAEQVLRMDTVAAHAGLLRSIRGKAGAVAAAEDGGEKDSIAAAQDQALGQLIGEAHTRGEVVPIGIPGSAV